MADKENRSPYILVADGHSSEALIAANTAIQIARYQNLSIRGLYMKVQFPKEDSSVN